MNLDVTEITAYRYSVPAVALRMSRSDPFHGWMRERIFKDYTGFVAAIRPNTTLKSLRLPVAC
jgi:hypothetical protein